MVKKVGKTDSYIGLIGIGSLVLIICGFILLGISDYYTLGLSMCLLGAFANGFNIQIAISQLREKKVK